jgi:hypothetical protein
MEGGPPQGERLELALRDHYWQHWIAEKRLTDSGREIKHVGTARRAQVFPLCLEAAGGIVFQVRMIAAKSAIAHLIRAGEEIGNENARVIPAAPAADNFAASERVHPAESGALGRLLIDPT